MKNRKHEKQLHHPKKSGFAHFLGNLYLRSKKLVMKANAKRVFPVVLTGLVGASVVCSIYALGIASTLVLQGDGQSSFQTRYFQWSNWVHNSHEIAADESLESSVLSGRKRGFVAALARYEGENFQVADADVFISGCQVFGSEAEVSSGPCYNMSKSSTGAFQGAKLDSDAFWLASRSGQLLWKFDSKLSPPAIRPESLPAYSKHTRLKRLLWGSLLYMLASALMLSVRWRQRDLAFQTNRKRLLQMQASGKRIFGEFFSGDWNPHLVDDESAIIHKLKRYISGGKRQGATMQKQDLLAALGDRLPATSFLRFMDMQVDQSINEHAGLRETLLAFKDQCNADFFPARDQFHILFQVWKEGIDARGLKRFLRYLSETPAGSHHANCLDRDLEFLESFSHGMNRFAEAFTKISGRFLDKGEERIAGDKKLKHFLMMLSGRNQSIRLQTVGDTLTHLFRDEVVLHWDYADLKEASVSKEILFGLFFSLELAGKVADVPSESIKIRAQGRLDTIYLAVEPNSFDQDQRSHYVESLRQIFRSTDYETFQVQLSGEDNKATLVLSWEPSNSSVLMMQRNQVLEQAEAKAAPANELPNGSAGRSIVS